MISVPKRLRGFLADRRQDVAVLRAVGKTAIASLAEFAAAIEQEPPQDGALLEICTSRGDGPADAARPQRGPRPHPPQCHAARAARGHERAQHRPLDNARAVLVGSTQAVRELAG